MFGKILDFFSKKENKKGEEKQNNNINEFLEYIRKEGILYNEDFDFNKKNVLIMDDKKDIVEGIIDDFFILDEKGLINIDDYNFFVFYGKMSAFLVKDFIEKFGNLISIDYAILDIIIGGKRFSNGKKIIYDGIDVSKILKEKYPNCLIIFYTGCMIENSDDLLMNISYVKKFKEYFDDNIYNYLMSKSENLDTEIKYLHKFLKGEYGF
jgi:hypothetical protein